MQARACYWLTLLKRFAKLLKFKPGSAAGERQYPVKIDALEWLETPDVKKVIDDFKLVVDP